MRYAIESVEICVRPTPPDRAAFTIGGSAGAVRRRPRGILLVRLKLSDQRGRSAWGVAGDRPSFGWLDKRPQFSPEQKLQRLLALVRAARDIYTDGRFHSPFEHWLRCQAEVSRTGARDSHEPLSAAYASALLERAMIDACCRLHHVSLSQALRQGLLGFDASQLDPSLPKDARRHFAAPPRTQFHIRHTVGLSDPLRQRDIKAADRISDGEPESLEQYARRDGLRYFKVKIAGDADRDLQRLERIWDVLAAVDTPVVTLDGNESYSDIEAFAAFVERFEDKLLGLFQHTAFIEQPLTRRLTLDAETRPAVARLACKKPLVIDEADGQLDSFRRALAIGYRGVSHKNCKGLFKSLVNLLRCRAADVQGAFQTGEDLSNMPLVPLHQDFAALGVLGITHCERNGHHYSRGLSHLSDHERELARIHHDDLYIERGGELFLNIRNGQVRCDSLQCEGFGVRFQPDWDALTPLDDWEVVW